MSVVHAHPDVGILGPVVFRRGWPNQIASAGLDYDTGTGRMRERRVVTSSAVIDVPAVSGCAMLVRRAVFDAVGPLPEDYFFGFEDIAFCQRAADAGFRVAVAGAARVFHDGAGSGDASADRLYYAARNHLRLGRETPARSIVHRAARQVAILSFNVAHVATSRDGSLPARLLAVAQGVFDHTRGRYGPR
jgi:GT2 family glycosyltransferase